MKRDLDLIRDLLFQVEKSMGDENNHGSPWRMFSSCETSSHIVNYHVRLLLDQRFLHTDSVNLEGQDQAGRPAAKFRPDALTNEGHEFLESVRDPAIWKKTKEGANKVGSFGFDLIKDLAKGFLQTEIKKRTGLDI